MKKTKLLYQIKITLDGIRPPIWRRILVPADTSMYNLHLMIQAVMGWYNSHLFEFEIDGMSYGVPFPELGDDIKSAKRARLNKLATEEGEKFTYIYDMGDYWVHKILLEKILPAEPGKQYPVCIKGKRACPPEDCGGVYGYYDLLEILSNPKHEDYEEMIEWVGGEYNPEAFSLAEVNERLADYKSMDHVYDE